MAQIVVVMAACASPDDPTSRGPDYAGSPADDDSDGDTKSDSGDSGDSPSGGDTPDGEPGSGDSAQVISLATGCPAYGSGVYTPFTDYSAVSTASVATLPWRGRTTSYPDSIEDFRGYPAVTTSVECSNTKGTRDYVDVTSGCLDAVTAGGDKVGRIHGTSSGYYRSFALPYDQANQRQVAWGDQGVEYRFQYSEWTGDASGPGFKAFVRYLTEYDLYVASWRMDGVVQIQKKRCGTYTVLTRNDNYGQPSPNVWHTMRFQVVGNELRLYLDGVLAMSATDDEISHGTAGLRIDSAEGALIDDWKVYAP
ncbi:MAG: hypothetical protein H0V17_08925 [Deltaproteobacteria bacterium]|nr:hypothetical protein [Deltaproteobacteria bacterium]